MVLRHADNSTAICRERDFIDHDVVAANHTKIFATTNVPKAQGSVLRAGGDCATAGRERQRASEVLMATEDTQAGTAFNIPDVNEAIRSAGDLPAVWRECDAHDAAVIRG